LNSVSIGAVEFRITVEIGVMELRIVAAQDQDLGRYIDLLEEVTDWLEARGIEQWCSGNFRLSSDYYAASIKQQEVQLAFVRDELVGTLRLLLREPTVWPDIVEDDAVYVYNLAVRRAWADRRLGRRMLEWAGDRAASLGRRYIRLDCVADNCFLREYYGQAGFEDRGEIVARFPAPIGTLRLRRYEKSVRAQATVAHQPAAPDGLARTIG
jgi:ribosomal protein S18 acetylase RimI-like enzyme